MLMKVRQAHDVVRPVRVCSQKKHQLEPERVPSMRKILLALTFLTCRPAYADDASKEPAIWGRPSVDVGKCCATLTEARKTSTGSTMRSSL